MPEDNKARIREFIDRVLTAGEIDATGDYFHSDVVEEVPFPGQGPGLHGLKETLTRIRLHEVSGITPGWRDHLTLDKHAHLDARGKEAGKSFAFTDGLYYFSSCAQLPP